LPVRSCARGKCWRKRGHNSPTPFHIFLSSSSCFGAIENTTEFGIIPKNASVPPAPSVYVLPVVVPELTATDLPSKISSSAFANGSTSPSHRCGLPSLPCSLHRRQ